MRLADKVFAPHYAAPMAMIANAATPILASGSADSEVLGQLAPGDLLDVLEVASAHCWGQRRADRIVGYVATSALTLPAGDAA